MKGVSDLQVDDDRVIFQAAGDIDAVIKALAAHHVVDLEAVHPSLEEVFLGYYREEGDG